MEEYIRFRETNNWEKERWRFYIPLMGNERAIRILADALDKLKPAGGCFVGKHIQYDIRMMPTSGDRVDRLCDAYKGKGGYMAYYNKLEGRLDIRAVKRAVRLLGKETKMWHTVEDDLYKGGIRRMMRPWKRRPSTIDWPTGQIRSALRRTPVSKWSPKPVPERHSAHARPVWNDRLCWWNRLPNPVSLHSGFRRGQGDRCWDALERLRDAGFLTVGDVADLTGKKLLATPGIGRETVTLARWMLEEVGLRLS